MTHVVVVGGGPAGLMAADVISSAGVSVTLYDAMPSVGRKLLMAGRGGLNLTHSEPLEAFLGRYGAARACLTGAVTAFPPDAVRQMATDLGQETFVGSSGRVFPRAMKASPLLRAWLARLARQGVTIRTRHRLVGIDPRGRALIVAGSGAAQPIMGDALVLALGGGSWPRLGSDGAWVPWLSALGLSVRPLVAANAGLSVPWSEHFAGRFAGVPLKRIAITIDGHRSRGEAIATTSGLEGGAIYALTPPVRVALSRTTPVTLSIDLRPDLALPDLVSRLSRPRGKQSASEWLRKTVHLPPVAIGLLREATGRTLPDDPRMLGSLIKAVPLPVAGIGSMARAISTAGGVALDEIDTDMMIKTRPGIFVAGEMLFCRRALPRDMLPDAVSCAILGVICQFRRVPDHPKTAPNPRGDINADRQSCRWPEG
jgi:uncharacterized flavoprotein (TIGR03862 family)